MSPQLKAPAPWLEFYQLLRGFYRSSCLRGRSVFSQFRVSRLRMQLQIHKICNLFAAFEIWSSWMWKMVPWWSRHRETHVEGPRNVTKQIVEDRRDFINATGCASLMLWTKSCCIQQRGLLTIVWHKPCGFLGRHEDLRKIVASWRTRQKGCHVTSLNEYNVALE